MMSPMKEGSCGVMVEGLSGLDEGLEVSEVGRLVLGESSPSSSSERSRMKRSARADIVVVGAGVVVCVG